MINIMHILTDHLMISLFFQLSAVHFINTESHVIALYKTIEYEKGDGAMKITALSIAVLLIAALSAHAGVSDFDVMNYGAVAGGAVDNTDSFQKALDTAGEKGGVVHVPCGDFLIGGSLIIPEGVVLEGMARGPHMPMNGTVTMLLAYQGRDDEFGAPFITLETNATLKGLSIMYPEQTPLDIRPYPWTVRVSGNRVNIIDVTLANSYNGIDCGTTSHHSHHLRNVSMTALRRGVYIDRCSDIGRIENVHIHAVNWWNVGEPYRLTPEEIKAIDVFTKSNLEGFIIGRCDWEYMIDCFVIWMKTGFHFVPTQMRDGEHGKGVEQPNILITQSGSDMSPLSVVIERVQDHAGIAFENCQFMNGFEIREGNTGPIKLTNCGFWGETNTGQLKGSIIINRGTGPIMMTSCHFSTWEDPNRKWTSWDPEAPLIDMYAGSLILSGCLFKDYGVNFKRHIMLREGIDAAVINGNIVEGGRLIVENKSKADVQIFGNVAKR